MELCLSPLKKKKLDQESALYEEVFESATSQYGFETADDEQHILKSLTNAKREVLSQEERVDVICFETADAYGISTESDIVPICTKKLYVRHFYDDLFDKIWQTRKSILLGNPGISKSWFHWFIIYKLANTQAAPILGPSYCGDRSPPAFIVRQIGASLLHLFFLNGSNRVLKSTCDTQKFLSTLPRDRTFYLIEPSTSVSEPIVTGMHTVITCSPDERRYKEFHKNGACRRYMPCWTLAELKAVAADIRETVQDPKHSFVPERKQAFLANLMDSEVEKRFNRFGGIFRHVLPASADKVREAEREQDAALSSVALRDVFDITTNIEASDTMKRNISHYVLQYKVELTGKGAFTSFEMAFTSEYTHAKMKERLNEVTWEEFRECAHGVQLMMKGGRQQRPDLFELVVKQGIFRKEIKWRRYESGSWDDHKWDVTTTSTLEKYDEKVQALKAGIYYTFADQKFPLIDSVFLENDKQVSSVQVTFAESHEKPLSVFTNAFSRLSLNEEKDKLKIYLITDPKHLDTYASRSTEQYMKNKPSKKDKDFGKASNFFKAVQFIPMKMDFGALKITT